MLIWDHILIGASIGLSNYHNNPAILATAISSSVIPDIDLVLGLPGSIKYLKYHRTFTHSIFLTPIYSFIIALIFFSLFDGQEIVELWLYGFIGILSHLLVDILNGFGAAIFYPINKKRIAFDILFEFDFLFTALLIILILSQIIISNYSPNNLLYVNIFFTLLVTYYIFERLKSKKSFRNSAIEMTSGINESIIRQSLVPASYWRWKAIIESSSNNYIIKNIKKKLTLEKRGKQDIPSEFLVHPVMIYKQYARHLDVMVNENTLILENLIYSDKTYKLSITFDNQNKYTYSITLPSLDIDEY